MFVPVLETKQEDQASAKPSDDASNEGSQESEEDSDQSLFDGKEAPSKKSRPRRSSTDPSILPLKIERVSMTELGLTTFSFSKPLIVPDQFTNIASDDSSDACAQDNSVTEIFDIIVLSDESFLLHFYYPHKNSPVYASCHHKNSC